MRRQRLRLVFAGPALALAVALLAGCGDDDAKQNVASVSGAGATPAASGSAAADPGQGREFAACMRENGVPDFPDPGPDGQFDLGQFRDADIDRDKLQSAQQACREVAPNGGQRPQLDAAQQEQFRQFAQCMRDNGVDVPDPDPNGGGFGLGAGDSFDQDDPKFQKAMEACQDKLTFLRGGNS